MKLHIHKISTVLPTFLSAILLLGVLGNVFAGAHTGKTGRKTAVIRGVPGDENWEVVNPSILGADAMINTIVVHGSEIYIGGYFTVVGNTFASHIAKWDGKAYHPLGSGMDSVVNALAIDKYGNLYAGGMFKTAGSVSANYIAKWNGSTWSPLGSGLYGLVYALAIDKPSKYLYVGGAFYRAGDKFSPCLARYKLSPTPIINNTQKLPNTPLKYSCNKLAIPSLGKHRISRALQRIRQAADT